MEDHNLKVPEDRPIKVYFVEMDDDNRERVLSGVLRKVRIKTDYDEYEIRNDYSSGIICNYRNPTRWILEEAEFIPNADGSVLRIESFVDDSEEREDDGF